MEKSESIKELVTALSKVQSVLQTAHKSTKNPFFHSNYADLRAIWDVAKQPLTNNGLSIVQIPEIEGENIILLTMLAHISGEYIISRYKVNPMRQVKDKGWEKSDDPQSIGSAITYARRYALCAMVGIVTEEEDDDGESAMGRGKKNGEQKGAIIDEGKQFSPPSDPEHEDGISEKQTKALWAISKNLGWSEDKIKDMAFRLLGHPVEHFKNLTKKEAGKIIEALQDEQRERARGNG